MWRQDDPQGNEAQKIKYDIVPYTRGRGLDLGCGPFKAYKHFIGVDNGHHWGTGGADVVSEATDLSLFATNTLDFVFSSHLLEHIQDAGQALSEWFRVLKPGGHLVLYLPHDELYPKVGESGANPDHKHNLNQDIIIDLMREVGGWNLVENELRDQDNGQGENGNEYSFFQVFQKRQDKKQKLIKPKPRKSVCLVRYGGFGDMIQASSVLPGLKAQGFHVTIMTTPNGHSIIKDDPNVDAFIIQDKDQVPNQELGHYFKAWEKKFTKFVNLSESVEGGLLAMPFRAIYDYPKATRHSIMDVNYLERTHDIAEVPHKFAAKFHPTKDEKNLARERRKEMGEGFVILWPLSGSSMHKVSPWTDKVTARLLIDYKDVKIVFVGDDWCKLLEGNSWDNEPRVFCRSGEWSIRDTLAFAQIADCVVGTETGVLNSVGLEDVPKVIALSHSTHENLTKHWKNTTILVPKETKCYPCHKLHYGRGDCEWVAFSELPEAVDGERLVKAPSCTVEISGDQYYRAIRDIIGVCEGGNVRVV